MISREHTGCTRLRYLVLSPTATGGHLWKLCEIANAVGEFYGVLTALKSKNVV